MLTGVVSVLVTTIFYKLFEEKILAYSPLNEVIDMNEDVEIT